MRRSAAACGSARTTPAIERHGMRGMSMKRFLAALGTLSIVSSACAPGDNPARRGLASGIDAIFEDLNSPDSPGGTVAVIRDGELLYSKGYGSAQLEYGIPNTPNTIFHVASVSKQFTAMAITLLAADDALSLDDQVQTHLNYVPELGRPVTLRQLIYHTSGIRDAWGLLGIAGWRLDDVITTDHVIGLMARQQELNFEPNSEYLYSNMGYTLLGEIVRAVSGMSLQEFTEKRIFTLLGMTRTHFHDDHRHAVEGRAYSYAPANGGGFQKSVLSYANAGATSLFTTAEDLARWLDNFRHEKVGGPEVLAMMKTRGTLNNGERVGYAHGLFIGDHRGLTTIGHGGGDAGFVSHVVWFSDTNTGVVGSSRRRPSSAALSMTRTIPTTTVTRPTARSSVVRASWTYSPARSAAPSARAAWTCTTAVATTR